MYECFVFYRIVGPHNKAVLAAVHAEIREHDEDCSLTTIRSKLPFRLLAIHFDVHVYCYIPYDILY